MDDPATIFGISASVSWRVPRKLTVTTSGGLPIPEDTPAMLNSASTGPSMPAAARSMDSGSARSTSWNSPSAQPGRRWSNPITSAPSWPSWRTTCSPMPDAHPVTTARRPS